MSAVNTNHVTLTGNLVRAPELRYTASQTPVCSFTLAVNRMPSKDGGQECDFIPVVVWGKAGESCDRYLSKGRKVLVEGRLQVRNYEGRDGRKVYVTEVVVGVQGRVEFLTPRDDQQGGGYSSSARPSRQTNNWQPDEQPMDISELDPVQPQNAQQDDTADIPF